MWREWTNRAYSYIIHTADQQASWNKLHVSKSDLSNLGSKLHPLCCLSTLLSSCSILWLPMCVTFCEHIQSSPFQWILFIVLILLYLFLLLYFLTEIHIKNYRIFLRSPWETHYSHAGYVKHLYLGAKECVVFSWCPHHYFSFCFYSDIHITV